MTPPVPVIRAARSDDLSALLALEERSFETDRLSKRALARAILSPSQAVLVVEAGDGILGSAIVGFRRGSMIARLTSIAIDPDATGRGLGLRLIRACEHAAFERGCDRLILEVRADNAPAIALYDKAGYSMFGRYADYYEDGEAAVRFEINLIGRLASGRQISSAR